MAVVWLVVATLVGLLVGRIIRERDRQVPPADPATPGNARKRRTRRVPGPGESRDS